MSFFVLVLWLGIYVEVDVLKAFICNNNHYVLTKMWEKLFNIQRL